MEERIAEPGGEALALQNLLAELADLKQGLLVRAMTVCSATCFASDRRACPACCLLKVIARVSVHLNRALFLLLPALQHESTTIDNPTYEDGRQLSLPSVQVSAISPFGTGTRASAAAVAPRPLPRAKRTIAL